MPHYDIAVPVVGPTMEDSVRYMKDARRHADILELRLDLIRDPDVPTLIKAVRVPKIATCRHKDEGGSFSGTEDWRAKLLQRTIHSGIQYVDVEHRHPLKLDLMGTRLISSYHDYSGTPPYERLLGLYNEIAKKEPYAVKMVTMSDGRVDNDNMMKLVSHVSSSGGRIIGFCMGDRGRETRALTMLNGGLLTFGTLRKGRESAPGQYPIKELRSIWNYAKS